MATISLDIINWKNIFAHARTFQEKKPTKWGFVEEFFMNDFYEKLYETYPKKDESWSFVSTDDKSAYRKWWTGEHPDQISNDVEDPNFSESWNQFYHYLFSEEFLVLTGLIACLVKAITLGESLFSIANCQHSKVSIKSDGLKTFKFGIDLRLVSCSIGWCVGPSSPRPMES